MLSFEDFELGRTFSMGPRKISAEEIIRFAKKFDPQPFHLDPESEQSKQVGGLIASGWHTCSIMMRMMCDAYLLESTSQGSAGLDEVRWLNPVRPNDVLSGTATVMNTRVSKSNPTRGFVTFAYEIQNQNNEPVMAIKGMGIFNTRDAKTTS